MSFKKWDTELVENQINSILLYYNSANDAKILNFKYVLLYDLETKTFFLTSSQILHKNSILLLKS